MENTVTVNAMSSSLLARDVYCICFTVRDSLDVFYGELASARKKFFTEGGKSVRVGKSEIIKGFDGKLRGKLTRHSFLWRKTANKVVLEEAFEQRNGYVLVLRDFHGVITARMFFDKNQLWIKSEYYEPRDYSVPRVILKPCDTFDGIERFDYDRIKKRSRSTILFPVSYLPATAEQSLLNARFGEPSLIVSTAEGDFCYCSESEALARKQALAEIGNGTIVLMPAWEVKDGSLSGGDDDTENSISFTTLEEYARIEPTSTVPTQGLLSETHDAKKKTDEPEAAEILHAAKSFANIAVNEKTETAKAQESFNADKVLDAEALEILKAAKILAKSDKKSEEKLPEPAKPSEQQSEITAEAELEPTEVKEKSESTNGSTSENEFDGKSGEGAPLSTESGAGYRGSIIEGKISGRGRTEQQNGLTAYDGEYKDGLREGFGSYYYKDGELCYAGFWKDDKKDGLGVSFRNTDHALHIAKWQGGQPEGFVSLFDKDGNLRYGGRIENGKKEGAGVSYNGEHGTVFVGKWKNGESTGLGSAFDSEGNLLYTGMWVDGKRCGNGTEFDQNGSIVFSGEWRDNKYHNGILYKKLTKQEIDENSGGLYAVD